MIAILDLVALGIFALIAIHLWKAFTGASRVSRDDRGPVIEGRAEEVKSSAAHAASLLREFENVRAELKGRYPVTFVMLGGYLNSHTIAEHGGLEGAVKEMISDWTPRRDEAMREITKLLAENDSEDEVRAIVSAACDADFSQEGYRTFLTWLLGRFNAL
ncbi:MAG: hypothetical protein AAB227_00980 [Pseudomonadota bacterium]